MMDFHSLQQAEGRENDGFSQPTAGRRENDGFSQPTADRRKGE